MIRKLLALSLCLYLHSLCSADVILQYGQGGTIGIGNSINVNAGSQLTLDIYLTQTGTDPGNGVLGDYRLSSGASTRGLGSFYMELAASNAANGLNQTGVRVADLSAFTLQSGFDGRSGETAFLNAPNGTVQAAPSSTLRMVGIAPDDPGDAGALVLQRFAAAPNRVVIGPNSDTVADNSIRLGSLTLNIAANASGAYTLTMSAPGSIQRSTLGNDITNGYFDVNFGTPFTINVSAVPEPATFALFSICATGLGIARFRRKAKK